IARAADVRGLLGRRGPQARQLLRKLVVDRLDCQPYEEGDRRGYRVSGKGTYAPLLPGGECPTSIWGSNGGEARAGAVVCRPGGPPPFPPFRVRCPFAEWTITRFSPLLIEPDVRFARIRLSDGFHTEACTGDPRAKRRSRNTPSSPKTTSPE